MIKQLKGHITEHQLELITEMIRKQYRRYLRLTGNREFTSIFAEEYTPHNRQHGISWAIASAFPSNTIIDNSLKVERLLYGKGHTRPILSNDVLELHILNKTTHFDANYLKQRYQYNANGFSNKKLFAYIKFSVEHKKLIFVSICLPDEDGKVVEEEVLLSRDFLKQMAA